MGCAMCMPNLPLARPCMSLSSRAQSSSEPVHVHMKGDRRHSEYRAERGRGSNQVQTVSQNAQFPIGNAGFIIGGVLYHQIWPSVCLGFCHTDRPLSALGVEFGVRRRRGSLFSWTSCTESNGEGVLPPQNADGPSRHDGSERSSHSPLLTSGGLADPCAAAGTRGVGPNAQ